MREAALVICKPYNGAGTGVLGGWPPEMAPCDDDSFAYIPDSPDDELRPKPWTVTTDIAQEVLLENDLVRVWRFELGAGDRCHAHQHVYPYFFYNLLPAQTRRLEWTSGETPTASAMRPKCPPTTATARKVFWLDTLEGGSRTTHFHALENHAASSPFRQFIVEFKAGASVQLRPTDTTLRDPTLVYLPGLHGGGSQFLPDTARCVEWAAPCVDGSAAVRAHGTVEAAAAEVLTHAHAQADASGGDIVLAGHSFGGMVAMEAARQWLDGKAPAGTKLGGLVLMSTVASAQSEAGRAAIARRRELALRDGLQAELDASWPSMVHPDSFQGDGRGGAEACVRAERDRNSHEAGIDAFLRQTDAIDARPCQHDTLRRLAGLDVPVLVVHGSDDCLAPLEEAAKTAASCGASGELCVLEATGHLALVERPQEVADTIRAWWRRVRGAKRTKWGGTSEGFGARDDHKTDQRGTDAAVDAQMSYCVPPPDGMQIGLRADAVAHPGLPTFSFYRQHGQWPLTHEPQVAPGSFVSDSVVPSSTRVHSARTASPQPRLATLGFEIHPSPPPERLDDDGYIEDTYYAHVSDLIGRATGAALVYPYDHVRRHGANPKPSGHGPPSYLVHTDSADRSWPWRVDEILESGRWAEWGPAKISEEFAREHMSGGRRWAIVNAWRHTGGEPTLRSTPLALLDGSTVCWDSGEVMYYPITMGDSVAFNYTLRHSDAHRWLYYPDMGHDELLLFKAFGAAERSGERPSVLFHSAFDLPNAQHCSPRASLEVRCVVAWR